MTNVDYETIIKNAAHENDELKDRVTELEAELKGRGERASAEGGAIDDNPLCRGCYRWRLAFAALVGGASGLIVLAVLGERLEWVRSLAIAVTGRVDAIPYVIAALVGLSAVVPVLIAVIEWKWLLYKHGYAGTFRAIAEMWAAFKKGLGK